MGGLPVIKASEVVKAFQKDGWRISHREGSHVILKKDGVPANLSIPVHGNKDIKRGLLRKQIAKSGLTVDQFIELLK